VVWHQQPQPPFATERRCGVVCVWRGTTDSAKMVVPRNAPRGGAGAAVQPVRIERQDHISQRSACRPARRTNGAPAGARRSSLGTVFTTRSRRKAYGRVGKRALRPTENVCGESTSTRVTNAAGRCNDPRTRVLPARATGSGRVPAGGGACGRWSLLFRARRCRCGSAVVACYKRGSAALAG